MDLRRGQGQTALFILKDITVNSGESTALDGCKEVWRALVPPSSIDYVLMSHRFDALNLLSIPTNKVKYVQSCLHPFTFYYKDEQGHSNEITLSREILVPDYRNALKTIVELETFSNECPLYTHMTRV